MAQRISFGFPFATHQKGGTLEDGHTKRVQMFEGVVVLGVSSGWPSLGMFWFGRIMGVVRFLEGEVHRLLSFSFKGA